MRRSLVIGGVSRYGRGILSLTDQTLASATEVPLGSRPNSVTTASGGRLAYVATEFAPGLSVIDLTDAAVVDEVEVGGFANSIALSPDGSRAYVAVGSGAGGGTWGSVVVVATATGEVLTRIRAGRLPRAVTVTPDGSRLLVADQQLPGVTMIDTATNEVVGAVETSQPVLRMAVDRRGRTLVLASLDELAIADPATGRITSTVPINGYPGGLALGQGGSLAFVSLYTGLATPAAFTVVNVEANRVIRQYANGYGHGEVAVTVNGTRAFVLDPVSRKTTSVDGDNGTATGSLLSPDETKPTCLALVETT